MRNYLLVIFIALGLIACNSQERNEQRACSPNGTRRVQQNSVEAVEEIRFGVLSLKSGAEIYIHKLEEFFYEKLTLSIESKESDFVSKDSETIIDLVNLEMTLSPNFKIRLSVDNKESNVIGKTVYRLNEADLFSLDQLSSTEANKDVDVKSCSLVSAKTLLIYDSYVSVLEIAQDKTFNVQLSPGFINRMNEN